jgi:hypothetical protein
MEALTLEYDYRDLRGEELEMFKNMLWNEQHYKG